MTFMILHFIGALFGGAAFCLSFVFGSEIVGINDRALGAGIIASTFSAAQMLLAIVAMFIIDFRVLLRILFGLVAFTLTFTYWLLPESPRWLLSVGRHKEGMIILEKITKLNKAMTSIDALAKDNKNNLLLSDSEETKNNEEYSAQSVLQSKVLCIRLTIFCFCYFTNALIYFGLSVYSSSLPGNKHMNLLYTGMVEIPGNLAAHYVLKYYGRKWTLMVSMLACSMACLGSEFLIYSSMKVIFFLIGKFTIALSYTIVNLYSVELFPTNLRQRMFNICSVFAGLGNMTAPLLPLSVSSIFSIFFILILSILLIRKLFYHPYRCYCLVEHH